MPLAPIVLIAIGVIVLIILFTNIHIVQQSRAYVIERLGGYHATWGKGPHIKLPFIDRVAKKLSLKEQVVDFAPQPVITKDNVTMQIDGSAVPCCHLYSACGVENPKISCSCRTDSPA